MNSKVLFCILSICVFGVFSMNIKDSVHFPDIEDVKEELPEEQTPYGQNEVVSDEIKNGGGPQARVTCDLGSGLGLNHTLCAAHCLLLGKKGGYCNDKGVCVCRN